MTSVDTVTRDHNPRAPLETREIFEKLLPLDRTISYKQGLRVDKLKQGRYRTKITNILADDDRPHLDRAMHVQ